MANIRVDLARVHLAGSNTHCDAPIEVEPHGFAQFLAPGAELDIDGPAEELDAVARRLQAALASRA